MTDVGDDRGGGARWRRGSPWLCLCLAIALPAAGATTPQPPPNILLITADTFRPDRLGYYRAGRLGEGGISPHLDTLSSEGVFFRQAFTTSAWTAPGLISIHTSLHAPVHGVDVRGRSLDPSVTTLAEALTAAGYRAPGVFFLKNVPNFLHLGMDESFPDRDRYLREGDEVLFHWLEHESARDDRPFFVYYHYRDLHQPYAPGPEYEQPYLEKAFGSPYNPFSWLARFLAADKMELVQREIMLGRGPMAFDEADRDWVRALYDAQIRRMDEQFFQRLRATLEETGLARNTLLLISADHGEELLDHGLIGHVSTFQEGRLYDELIRIPLIAWFPRALPAGRLIDAPVQCIDVMPTALELAGVPVPERAQGRSLLPLIAGTSAWEARPVFTETSGGGYTADAEQYAERTRAVRTDRWKLIRSFDSDGVLAAEELYDLSADPEERRNVLQANPGTADSLRVLLHSWSLDSQVRRALSGQPRPASASADEPVTASSSAPPRVIYPPSGDTLGYVGADQTIELRWTGDSTASYVIEYAVGEGDYHLAGELPATGTEPAYGPFHATFWNSLVLYNPWRFRVRRADAEAESASPWVTFHLAPTQAPGGGTGGLDVLLMQAVIALRQGGTDAVNLVGGLGLGLLELCLWVSGWPAADVSAWLLIGAIVLAAVWPRLRGTIGAERCRAWGLGLVYVAIVYSTLGLFPTVWRRLRELTDGAIEHLGTVVAVASIASLLWVIGRRTGRRSWVPYAGLAAIAIAYGYLLYALSRFPAERLHLLEYGLMSYLILRALQLDMRPRRAYVLSLVLTTLVGIGDETVQWMLPQRFFELEDILLNAVSAGLGLLLTYFAVDFRRSAVEGGCSPAFPGAG